MNNYLKLDGYKYMTPARNWRPIPSKPATTRVNLDGSTDVTYGPATINQWVGDIIAPVTAPGGGWGTKALLDVTIAKRQAVAFEDHYGNACNVHVLGSFEAISRSPMWDGASNEFLVAVVLLKVQS